MKHLAATLAIIVLVFTGLACSGGGGGGGITGWEVGSEYDQYYDLAEYDKIKGYFVDFVDITPLEGMSQGMGIVMRDRADGENVTVIIGPKTYVEADLNDLGLRDGMKIKAYGSWAYIDGKDVLMATKVKRTEEAFVKVRRTKDGYPYWSMTKEEVQHELAGDLDPEEEQESAG